MWTGLINGSGDRLRKWAQGAAARFRRLSDRRRAPRYNIPRLNVYHWTGAVPKPEEVASISETGAYFKTPDRWGPGTIIELTLQQSAESGNGPAGPHVSQHVAARVVRSDAGGLGVQFLYAKPQERARVREFLTAVRSRSH